MPQVPLTGANLSAYDQSPLAPSQGNLLMAAAIQSQDPNRSMPNPPNRPKFPAQKLRRRMADPLKGK